MKPRVRWTSFALMLIFGSYEFTMATRSPRYEMMHAIDVAQLLVSGLCFGVALSTMAIIIRGSRTAQNQNETQR
jgi:hypothetical protein